MLPVASLPAPPTLALFDMLGGSELLVIFILALLFFGGEKMPEFARGLAKVVKEFRKAASGVEEEFKRAIEEDPAKPHPGAPSILPPKPPTGTVASGSLPTPATPAATEPVATTPPTPPPSATAPAAASTPPAPKPAPSGDYHVE